MTEAKKASFLPFHAINDFMIDDYRQQVFQRVLEGYEQLSSASLARLNASIKRHVQVPGFRNSAKAPKALILRHLSKPFEKSSELAAAVVAAWAELNSTLSTKVFDVLTGRGWEMLPVDADRTRLPGFFTRWPSDENYDTVFAALQQAYPDEQFNQDDVSLMSVWLSMRLPYESTATQNVSTGAETQA